MPCLFISIFLSLATIWYTRLRRIHKSYSPASLFRAFIFLAFANVTSPFKMSGPILRKMRRFFERKQFYWKQNQISTMPGLQATAVLPAGGRFPNSPAAPVLTSDNAALGMLGLERVGVNGVILFLNFLEHKKLLSISWHEQGRLQPSRRKSEKMGLSCDL